MSKKRKLRSSSSVNERGEDGKFIRSCGCVMHTEWSDSELFALFNVKTSRKYSIKVVELMKSQNFLSPYGNMLCTACYKRFRERQNERSQSNFDDEPTNTADVSITDINEQSGSKEGVPENTTAKDDIDRLNNLLDEMNTIVSGLTEESIDRVDRVKIGTLLNTIGLKFIQSEIKSDGLAISSSYKSISYLSTINSKQFLNNRNQLLLDFIYGAVNCDYKLQDNTVLLYSFAMTIEMIYFLRNNNLILPHCFMANLVQSFIAGSKMVSVINGKTSPGASYTTYKNWMVDKGAKSIPCPANDTITFFDNIGRYIVKNYRVSSERSPSADIITATLHFINEKSTLQENENYSPGRWRGKDQINVIQTRMREVIARSNSKFRQFRLHFIEKILESVLNENLDVERKISTKQAAKRKCTNKSCGKTFDTLKRKCDICFSQVGKVVVSTGRLTSQKQILSRNFDFETTVNESSAVIKMGDPILVNPNSYDNVKIILDTYKEQQIKSKKKWTVIGCDGPLYCLASRIIESNEDDYDWVTMTSGLGHLHMNQMKTLFNIIDKIIMEPLGKEVLGFGSPNAYQYFVGAKDTHKAYQALLVLLEGTASEMCSMYIKENSNSLTLSAQGFLDWANDIGNESFHLVFEIIFNYALAIYVQKIGVRANNSTMIEAGRLKFMPMFYGFRHPIYQEIEYRELSNRTSCPTPVLEFLNENMAFKTSSLAMTHQGGDFCLENKIQRHKLIAPKGQISNDTWRSISRGLDDLERVYKNAADMLQIEADDCYRDTDLYDEVVSWRAVLRCSKMLERRSEEGEIRNIFGEPLSYELDEITVKLVGSMEDFWSSVKSGKPIQHITTTNLKILPDNGDMSLSDTESFET